MVHKVEEAEARLQNIQAVTPVLTALRTISLGSWQTSMNRRRGLDRYADRILRLLPMLLPHLPKDSRSSGRWLPFIRRSDEGSPSSNAASSVTLLIIGSERGLCGRYNDALLDRLKNYMTHSEKKGQVVRLAAMGRRLIRELTKRGYEIDGTWSRPVTSLPGLDLARELVGAWLQSFEDYEIDAVEILYNAHSGAGEYESKVFRLIPPAISLGFAPDSVPSEDRSAAPIIETDPTGIYVRIIEQWMATTTYRLLLEATGTEHAARYQLMESATQNADDLIEELTRGIKSGRRRAITQEMQELAVASGLLED